MVNTDIKAARVGAKYVVLYLAPAQSSDDIIL
jgi:hypothetical protein